MKTTLFLFPLLLAACVDPAATDDPDAGTEPDLRQADRDASIFTNLSFEEVDAAGTAQGWTCHCSDPQTGAYAEVACATTTDHAVHGERALELGGNCEAYQLTSSHDSSRRVRFDLFGAGAVVYPTTVTLLVSSAEQGFVEGIATASEAWAPIRNAGATSTAGSGQLVLWINNTTPDILRVDDIIAVQDGPNPAPKSATLLTADHFEGLTLAAGSGPTSVYTPLPIDYATQVPLDVDLAVEPATTVDHVDYVEDAEGNWGAIVHFGATTAQQDVTLAWRATVMARVIGEAARPAVFAADGDPAQWLAASPVVDATDAGIVAHAATLELGDGSPLARMLATIQFTSSYITNQVPITALDASTAFESRSATCTGYANLAAATGRALGVPTRHVVNIMVGASQQMHSIDEFYLGADLGWRRVEPQSTGAVVAEDYALVIRLAEPADEGSAALAPRPFAAQGVPLHELTEPVRGAQRLAPRYTDHFADCFGCLNRADKQAILRADPAEVEATFARARASWAIDRASYLAGGPSAGLLAGRRAFRAARTLADVDAILATLP